jgi:hypothetical protein
MVAQKGKDLLLKIDGGGTFVTVAGLRSKRLAFTAEVVDITEAESAGRWRELLDGACVQRASLTGAGTNELCYRTTTTRGLGRFDPLPPTAKGWRTCGGLGSKLTDITLYLRLKLLKGINWIFDRWVIGWNAVCRRRARAQPELLPMAGYGLGLMGKAGVAWCVDRGRFIASADQGNRAQRRYAGRSCQHCSNLGGCCRGASGNLRAAQDRIWNQGKIAA